MIHETGNVINFNNYDNKNEKKISATVNRKFLNKKIIDCLGDGAV